MTLKETVLCELETADEQLLEEVMRVIRSRKQNPSTGPSSSEPIRRGAKLGDLLAFAGTWAGDDLQDCEMPFTQLVAKPAFPPTQPLSNNDDVPSRHQSLQPDHRGRSNRSRKYRHPS